MKKLLNSRLATIAAAGIIVALSGGTGAYAATAIGGDTIVDNTLDSTEVQNGSLSGVDVDNGTLTGLDIKNQTLETPDLADGAVNSGKIADSSIQFQDLAPDTTDGILARMKNSGQLNNANWQTQWSSATAAQPVSVPNNSMVSLNASATGDQPVLVEFRLSGVGAAMRCVTTPTQYGNFCSVTDVVPAGSYTVDLTGGSADVTVNGITVGSN